MTRFFKLFSKENSVRSASLLLIVTLSLSNLLGLLRDRFLTKNILTSNLDIYYAAFRIPDLIFNLLILGAITSAFIPIFSEFLARKEDDSGYKVANSLINLALLFTLVSALLLYFLMPYLMPFVVPKFDGERLALAVRYSRLLMITPVFFSISYILGGILNSYKRFFAYSLAPLFYNLSIIFGAYFLAPKMGVVGVIYSVIAGSMLHFLIQLPAVLKLGFRFRLVFDFADENIKKIIHLMIPRTISMGASQVMLIVYTAIGSALAAGSIAAFNLGNNISTMPVVALGTSFATAIFPTLAAKIAQKDELNFSFYLNRSLRVIGYLLIPSTALFILLRAQIIRLILGSGKFSWDDTRMTATVLGFLSVSILAQGLIPLLSRAFYALKDTKTPMNIAIITVVFSVVIAFPLAKVFGIAGLALAYSLGSYLNALLLVLYLRKLYPHLVDQAVFISYLKTFLISLVMAFAVRSSLHLMIRYVDMSHFLGVLFQTIVATGVGLAVFMGLSYFFDQDEMKWAISRKING